jgi:hypothetical protein
MARQIQINTPQATRLPTLLLMTFLSLLVFTNLTLAAADSNEDVDQDGRRRLSIEVAQWNPDLLRLDVSGERRDGLAVGLVNADDRSQRLGIDRDRRTSDWRIAVFNPNPVPCRVRARTRSGLVAERAVTNAPEDCAIQPGGGAPLPPPSPDDPHAEIDRYEGPATCLECHEDQARDMHGSVHYQQNGPADFVTNIPVPAGEYWNGPEGLGVTGINTYCGAHENSPRFTCAGCHVGNGRDPLRPEDFARLDPTAQWAELRNIDCLTCHQNDYRRFPDLAQGTETLSIVAPDPLTGRPNPDIAPMIRTGSAGIPAVDPQRGDFDFIPADPTNPALAGAPVAFMPYSATEAARRVHATTRKSCLSCHVKAGGGDGTKRGDLSSLLIDPTPEIDVHMSRAGAGMVCADCHAAGGHRMRGRGLDLRPNDVPERLACTECHEDRPHGDYSARDGRAQDTHAQRVACQTCHIPTYAKGMATEVARDWEDPHWFDSTCNGRGGWLPREDKAAELIPSYRWFYGSSQVSYLGEPLHTVPRAPLTAAQADALGLVQGVQAYLLGLPNGDVASPGAQIHPMKEHLGKLARNQVTDTLIAHSTFEFFRTGDFARAIIAGLEQTQGMEATDPYEVTPVHTYQSINHGVEDGDHALACGACHAGLVGGPLRMDLTGQLGYALKGPEQEICTQCHDWEGRMSFVEVHEEHVREEGKDCAVCHGFSRPGRGLSLALNDGDDGDDGDDGNDQDDDDDDDHERD